MESFHKQISAYVRLGLTVSSCLRVGRKLEIDCANISCLLKVYRDRVVGEEENAGDVSQDEYLVTKKCLQVSLCF